jgi:hypothetical protein
MKWRSVLPMLVSTLLIGGYAGVAAADPAVAPTVPALSSPAPTGTLPFSCGANISKLAPPAVSSPVVNRSEGEICGACSTPVCRGVAWGSGGCNLRNPISYRCIDALATTCSDGTPQCQCWSGPPP